MYFKFRRVCICRHCGGHMSRADYFRALDGSWYDEAATTLVMASRSCKEILQRGRVMENRPGRRRPDMSSARYKRQNMPRAQPEGRNVQSRQEATTPSHRPAHASVPTPVAFSPPLCETHCVPVTRLLAACAPSCGALQKTIWSSIDVAGTF